MLRRKNLQRFLITFVALGALWGLVETYLFISLTEVGISKQTLGISQSLATLTGKFAISGFLDLHLKCRLEADLVFKLEFYCFSAKLEL